MQRKNGRILFVNFSNQCETDVVLIEQKQIDFYVIYYITFTTKCQYKNRICR